MPKIYLGGGLAVVVALVIGFALSRGGHKPVPAAPSAGAVAVRISTSPADSTVRVKESDQTCSTAECSLNLPPGDYTLQVDHPGYQPLTRTITVKPDGNNQISLNLTPNPSSPAASAKNVNSSFELRNIQPGTEVLLDGQRAGTVGKRGTFSMRVPVGNHAIGLMAKGQPARTLERAFGGDERVTLESRDFASSKPAPANTTPANATPVNAAPAADEAAWRKVEGSNNIADVESFLKQYPSSPHSPQAQAKADRLSWESASGSKTIAAFNQYLQRFPQGQYSQQAQNEIAALDWHGYSFRGAQGHQ